MELKKVMKRVFLVLAATALLSAHASRKDEITLVIVPREERAVQIGMDLANHYPTLLVSYQAVGAAMSLHGWTGTQWVNISAEDFAQGNFFRTGPESALIITADNGVVPAQLVPSENWVESVSRIGTTEVRPMLHLLGQYYDFKYKDWQWFSTRYRLPVEAINPEGLNIAWYHKRLKDHFETAGNEFSSDLNYWAVLRYPEPPVEPVEIEPVEPVPVQDEGEMAEPESGELSLKKPVEPEVKEEADRIKETVEEPAVDPFTNEAPAAVILGAGDAVESE